MGIPPIQVEDYLQAESDRARLSLPPSGPFEGGHALIIGVANYSLVHPLPETVLNDARDLVALLTDPSACGYLPVQVTQLLDEEATGDGIRAALVNLAERTSPDDTAIVFFSGHD